MRTTLTKAMLVTLLVGGSASAGPDISISGFVDTSAHWNANNTGKTILGKAAWGAEAWGVTGSFLAGPEQAGNSGDYRQSYDVTGFVIVEGVKVNLQTNYGNETVAGNRVHWVGGGIQPVVPVTEALSIGARVERFRDPEGARTGAAGGPTVTNVSVAPAWAITKALTVRVEARVDVSSGGDAFEDASGDPKDSQATLSAEVFFRF